MSGAGSPGRARGRRARCSRARCCGCRCGPVLAGAALAGSEPRRRAGGRALAGRAARRVLFAAWCGWLARHAARRRWRSDGSRAGGKVALVTGGSKGIGRGIARGLVAEGAKVAVTSRVQERAERGGGAIGAPRVAFDSDDLDAIDAAARRGRGRPRADRHLHRQHRRPAGRRPARLHARAVGGGAAHAGRSPRWRSSSASCRGCASAASGASSPIGSMAVREPIDALQLSNAHRPGLVAAFKVLARQDAADGVTFNTVHPGRIATDRMIDTAGSLEAAEEAARKTIPAGRLGTVEELAAAAVVPVLRAGELHHGHDAARRRRRDEQRVACGVRAASSIGRARDFHQREARGALTGRPSVRRRLFAGTP